MYDTYTRYLPSMMQNAVIRRRMIGSDWSRVEVISRRFRNSFDFLTLGPTRLFNIPFLILILFHWFKYLNLNINYFILKSTKISIFYIKTGPCVFPYYFSFIIIKKKRKKQKIKNQGD